MPFNNEIEKTKKEIEVLTKKLSFLEELSQTKTPAEIAYKNAYGEYPMGEPFWVVFKTGYESATQDYKVGEYQEPEELKTLYQMLDDKKHHPDTCVFICDIVKEWMSQYTHNVMSGEYLKGYEECLTVLEENLQ